jgi:hypothetical protein
LSATPPYFLARIFFPGRANCKQCPANAKRAIIADMTPPAKRDGGIKPAIATLALLFAFWAPRVFTTRIPGFNLRRWRLCALDFYLLGSPEKLICKLEEG